MKNPWEKVANRQKTPDIDAELEALVKSKLIDPAAAKKARVKMLEGDLPGEALSDDEGFLNKVFKKK